MDELLKADLHFGHGTDNAWDEAVCLVLHVAGLSPNADTTALTQALPAPAVERIVRLLQRRVSEHLPLPYLLGRAWFAGLEFLCDERALVPRSPLAELIARKFAPWYAGPAPQKVLDLCCGGGCIGLATAHYLPDVRVTLADVDAQALALAAENIRLHRLESTVESIQSDVFSALDDRKYDIIVSNPPYVDARDLATMPEEFHHEPAIGLGSGHDGLDLTHRILSGARHHLSDHGLLVVEVGNSWEALETSYPEVPFTWLEFENGGHGVFVLRRSELEEYRACWR